MVKCHKSNFWGKGSRMDEAVSADLLGQFMRCVSKDKHGEFGQKSLKIFVEPEF